MKKTFYLCAILALVISLSACTSKNSKESDPSAPADKIETLSDNKSSEGDEDWEKAADNLEKARAELQQQDEPTEQYEQDEPVEQYAPVEQAPPSIPAAKPKRAPAGLLQGHVIREGGYTNVRQGPGTNYAIVQKIKDGSPIYYTNYNGNWRVVYDNYGNALGYMHSSKVIPSGAPAAAPRSNRSGVAYGTPYDWLSTRYATANDLNSLDLGQLRVLRNSIYARHGRKFKDANLRRYFNSQPWYNGYREEISANELNK